MQCTSQNGANDEARPCLPRNRFLLDVLCTSQNGTNDHANEERNHDLLDVQCTSQNGANDEARQCLAHVLPTQNGSAHLLTTQNGAKDQAHPLPSGAIDYATEERSRAGPTQRLRMQAGAADAALRRPGHANEEQLRGCPGATAGAADGDDASARAGAELQTTDPLPCRAVDYATEGRPRAGPTQCLRKQSGAIDAATEERPHVGKRPCPAHLLPTQNGAPAHLLPTQNGAKDYATEAKRPCPAHLLPTQNGAADHATEERPRVCPAHRLLMQTGAADHAALKRTCPDHLHSQVGAVDNAAPAPAAIPGMIPTAGVMGSAVALYPSGSAWSLAGGAAQQAEGGAWPALGRNPQLAEDVIPRIEAIYAQARTCYDVLPEESGMDGTMKGMLFC